VTDDGAETDLDLGHYERFLNIPTSAGQTISRTGRIYNYCNPLKSERGEYLGKNRKSDSSILQMKSKSNFYRLGEGKENMMW